MNRKVIISVAILMITMMGIMPGKANAWCDNPRQITCTYSHDSTTAQGHTDVSSYGCAVAHGITFSGKCHVYRINHAGGPLSITLGWTGTVPNHELWVFLLSSCDANACLAGNQHQIDADVSAGTYWIIVAARRNYTTSYHLELYCGDRRLPVELISFDAAANSNGIALNWSVASELNNNRFEIERWSGDDEATRIASVPSRGDAQTTVQYGYTDATAVSGVTYTYALSSVDQNGTRHDLGTVNAVYNAPPATLTGDFRLVGNFPNPFNPTTTIRFEVAQPMNLSLSVYDVNGRLVRTLANGAYTAGTYNVNFDGSDLASGLYFARLTGASRTDLMKLVLMK
jgi:hypothetical protein